MSDQSTPTRAIPATAMPNAELPDALSQNGTPSVSVTPVDRQDHLMLLCERGLEACRQGRWKEGLNDLAGVAESRELRQVPSVCYSYLGYGIARYRRQVDKGIRLCRHAIKIEFYQPENYLNLARTYLLTRRFRREAYEAIRNGLRIDPDHVELQRMHHALGARRPPVLSFLRRNHPLNRACGWLRSRVMPQPSMPEDPDDDDFVPDPTSLLA